jgi:hypothetical protein
MRTPNDTHAVDPNDMAVGDVATQLGIVPRLDELGHVEGDVLRHRFGSHGMHRTRDCFIGGQGIDLNPKEFVSHRLLHSMIEPAQHVVRSPPQLSTWRRQPRSRWLPLAATRQHLSGRTRSQSHARSIHLLCSVFLSP